jgi:hypothetical protein
MLCTSVHSQVNGGTYRRIGSPEGRRSSLYDLYERRNNAATAPPQAEVPGGSQLKPSRSGGCLDRTGRPDSGISPVWGTGFRGVAGKNSEGIMYAFRENLTTLALPLRRPISDGAKTGSDNAGMKPSGLFLTWCRPRPNVGVVFSRDCARVSTVVGLVVSRGCARSLANCTGVVVSRGLARSLANCTGGETRAEGTGVVLSRGLARVCCTSEGEVPFPITVFW